MQQKIYNTQQGKISYLTFPINGGRVHFSNKSMVYYEFIRIFLLIKSGCIGLKSICFDRKMQRSCASEYGQSANWKTLSKN